MFEPQFFSIQIQQTYFSSIMDSSLECKVCMVKFVDIADWFRHMGGKKHLVRIQNNLPINTYFCSHCEKQLQNHNSFRQHLASKEHWQNSTRDAGNNRVSR